MHEKKLLIILSGYIIIAFLSQNVFALSNSHSLNVPSVKQVTVNSCWAASATSICTYLGKYMTQTQFANFANVSIYSMANINQVYNGFRNANVYCSTNDNALSYGAVQNIIWYMKKPIFAEFHMHCVVIDGYSNTSGQNLIRVMDPANGTFHYYNHQKLITTGDQGQWWVRTISNF